LEYEARRRLYIRYFNIKERNWIIPFKLVIRKLRRIRRGVGKGACYVKKKRMRYTYCGNVKRYKHRGKLF
jgi:hypothetical protein